eukprot:TRINITY_DN74534_c0_g1_i1.p1 TRINITY_DN74534_c0_g1~~TRINITY_DN74534_c0_g1_i1.p1  ORF type:complete len:368 (-),score=48.14 TRINITY_DN74534_c0_g1_i1:58-1107(-)
MLDLPMIDKVQFFGLPSAVDFSFLARQLPCPPVDANDLSAFESPILRRSSRSPASSSGASDCITPRRRDVAVKSPVGRTTRVKAGGDGYATPPCIYSGETIIPPAPRFSHKRADDDLEEGLEEGSLPFVEMALLRGSECRCAAQHCFHEAVRRLHLPAVKFLLSEGNSAVNDVCGGRRMLDVALAACRSPHDDGYAIADLLLSNGASTDSLCGAYSPLRDAAGRGNLTAVSLLLAHGADANAADVSGATPLHCACQQASIVGGPWCSSIVRSLLAHGASPLQEDAAGSRARVHAESWVATDVRTTLSRAERHWNRRSLLLARGRGLSRREGVAGLLFMPELLDCVAELL